MQVKKQQLEPDVEQQTDSKAGKEYIMRNARLDEAQAGIKIPANGKVIKDSLANKGGIRDTGLIPGLQESPGRGRGNLLHYSHLEIHMDRGA